MSRKGMASPLNAEVNPQLVTLARQARGLTQVELAKLAGTGQATISKIEAGLVSVSEVDLQKIAKAVDFPPHFFTGQTRVEGPALAEYIHRKRAKASALALHRLHALATIRAMQVKVLIQSWENESLFPSYSIEDFEANPQRIAQTVRAIWRVPPGPVFNVTELVEEAGAIVISLDFGTRHIDGFSRWPNDGPPLIFINEQLPPDRWRWTLTHEVAHIVMHSHCDPYVEMEKDADLFAGEFLMPANEIGPQLTQITIDRLANLKRYWKVAMQAIIMRAGHLGRITANQKRYLFMQLSKAGYRLREPAVLDPPEERPSLLRRMVNHHRRNLAYSIADLCKVLAISESDLRSWFMPDEPNLRVLN